MKMKMMTRTVLPCLLLGTLFSGCASDPEESAEPDELTEHVGEYPPAPAGHARPRVGVPPFVVTLKKEDANSTNASESVNDLASDQLTTICFQSKRFKVIERAQLKQLLREQGLEGIVRADEMAQPGEVRGVDFLMYGKVTNLRIKQSASSGGFRIVSIPFISGIGYEESKQEITVDCGVDLRLVNPTTGEVVAAHFGEYKKRDTIEGFGLTILGVDAGSGADQQVQEDNYGKILRLALDEAFRKMLPDIDQACGQYGDDQDRVDAKKPKCESCGDPLESGAKFCQKCGKKKKAAPVCCGKTLKMDAKFCSECGESVGNK